MRIFFTILVATLIMTNAFAQAPEKMSYQAVIRNNNADLVTNTQIGIKISILQNEINGAAVYAETHNPKTNDNGLISFEIGNGTIISGNFSSIDWSSGPYFIKTEIDPTGGTNYSINSTHQLLSVPYALHAKIADSIIQDVASKKYVDELYNSLHKELYGKGFNGYIKDREGNMYKTVKIGTQIWMAENLRSTKLNNGDEIPLVTDNIAWSAMSTPAYCWLDNDEHTYKIIYGALYNWYVVGTGDLCPTGWHVPTHQEVETLNNYLIDNKYGYGGSGNDIAKSLASTSGWVINNNVGNVGYDQTTNNSSGFLVFPSEGRGSDGTFSGGKGYSGDFWSSTSLIETAAMGYGISSAFSTFSVESGVEKRGGSSVRCLKN